MMKMIPKIFNLDFNRLLGDPASLEANVKDVQQDPYWVSISPSFSPRGGFPTALKAPH